MRFYDRLVPKVFSYSLPRKLFAIAKARPVMGAESVSLEKEPIAAEQCGTTTPVECAAKPEPTLLRRIARGTYGIGKQLRFACASLSIHQRVSRAIRRRLKISNLLPGELVQVKSIEGDQTHYQQ